MSVSEKIMKGYLPMTEASFLLLASLIHGNHGYGIMQQVSHMTAGRVTLGAGTVYTILYRMESDGLIEPSCETERRKVYIITPLGYDILRAETERLKELYNIAAALG